ncbi:hypothetical protein V8C44DRAFT_145585 [Trichoderma aethiopicum]
MKMEHGLPCLGPLGDTRAGLCLERQSAKPKGCLHHCLCCISGEDPRQQTVPTMLSILLEARNGGQYQDSVSHNTTPRAPRIKCGIASRPTDSQWDSVLVLGSPAGSSKTAIWRKRKSVRNEMKDQKEVEAQRQPLRLTCGIGSLFRASAPQVQKEAVSRV